MLFKHVELSLHEESGAVARSNYTVARKQPEQWDGTVSSAWGAHRVPAICSSIGRSILGSMRSSISRAPALEGARWRGSIARKLGRPWIERPNGPINAQVMSACWLSMMQEAPIIGTTEVKQTWKKRGIHIATRTYHGWVVR